MKRQSIGKYLVFGGKIGVVLGGWLDFYGDFRTLRVAKAAAKSLEWFHIIDKKTGDMPWGGLAGKFYRGTKRVDSQ